jgi:hypothetical protein
MEQRKKVNKITSDQEYTDEEIRRWLWLRAVEWAAWPSFITQPIIPILVIFFDWWFALAFLFVFSLFLCLVRYKYINVRLANTAVLFVKLKWPIAIGSSIYLFIVGRYISGLVVLFWPGFLAGLLHIPAEVGRIELLFAKKIGYVDEDVEL